MPFTVLFSGSVTGPIPRKTGNDSPGGVSIAFSPLLPSFSPPAFLASPAGAAEVAQAWPREAARVYFPPVEACAAVDARPEAALPDAEPVGLASVVRRMDVPRAVDLSQAGAEDGSVPRALDDSLVASPQVEPVPGRGLDSVVRQPEQPQAAESLLVPVGRAALHSALDAPR
jgi:hypothetical protein